MAKEKSFKERMAHRRALGRALDRYLRKECPDRKHHIWHIQRIMPDHCPNCGKDFTYAPYSLASSPKTQRRYSFHEPYCISICAHCDAVTATIELESRVVKSKKQAIELVRHHGFTFYYNRLVTKKEYDDRLARPHELHPLGIGLAIVANLKRATKLIQYNGSLALDRRARIRLTSALAHIDIRQLAKNYEADMRALLDLQKKNRRRYRRRLAKPARTRAPLTAGTPATEY